MNRELQALGKKLKVDFGQITSGSNAKKLKDAGKKVAQSIYNVEELKKAGRNYFYNERNLQTTIDRLQARYNKASISIPNSVQVTAINDELGKVKALTVEYENLEHQLVKVNYAKGVIEGKTTADGKKRNRSVFVETGSVISDATEGKAYQETLSFLNKIDTSYNKIKNNALKINSLLKKVQNSISSLMTKLKSISVELAK